MGCGASKAPLTPVSPAPERQAAPPAAAASQAVGQTTCSPEAVQLAFASAKAAGRTPAVIVLAGTFNPVHAGHVKCVQDARAFLEASTTYTVVAGLLSPASDARTSRKFKRLGKGRPMLLTTRVMACEMATSHLPWLGVLSAEAAEICASCVDSTEAVRRAADFALQGGATAVAFQITTSESVDSYGGWDGIVQWEVEELTKTPERVFPKRLVMVRPGSSLPPGEPPEGWHAVHGDPAKAIDVSSTKVRALIDAGNWDELARPDMLGPAESACLKERHEAGQLYFE